VKVKIASHLVALVMGGLLAWKYVDYGKHTVKEKVVYKDRINTVIREVIAESPDGTRVTKREITKVETSKMKATKAESKPTKKRWAVGIQRELLVPDGAAQLSVQRRVFGDIYAGVYGNTNGSVGLSVTILF
jgi:hypothetical protein